MKNFKPTFMQWVKCKSETPAGYQMIGCHFTSGKKTANFHRKSTTGSNIKETETLLCQCMHNHDYRESYTFKTNATSFVPIVRYFDGLRELTDQHKHTLCECALPNARTVTNLACYILWIRHFPQDGSVMSEYVR